MTSPTAVRNLTSDEVLARTRDIARRWALQRDERQQRTTLDPADFDELIEAGVHLTAVPAELGGVWQGVLKTTRSNCEILKAIAKVDPSVALVTVMHSAVLQDVLRLREAAQPHTAAWETERRWVFDQILGGHWFGTLGSEPGKASDRERNGATIRPGADGGYRMSGRKHFGSGSGIVSYFLSEATCEGEDSPETVYLDLRGIPHDGSAGVRLVAPWDGLGMRATQSNSYEFQDFPVVRSVLPKSTFGPPSPYFPCAYSAVGLGVVEAAIEATRSELDTRAGDLGPFEQVEWANAQMDAWLMQQAFEGMLRAIEQRSPSLGAEVMRGKVACGQLAESALTSICRVVGARTYSRSSPYGNWFEDVRALGFLRPGWRTAFDSLMMR
jgi:alkylation response protein AidB-like acyl-CoA dehydrogenase